MFKKSKETRPAPIEDRHRGGRSHRRHQAEDRLHITADVSGEAATCGVARRITPVFNTTSNTRDCSNEPTSARRSGRPTKGAACLVADEHNHFASALARRMERFIERPQYDSNPSNRFEAADNPEYAALDSRLNKAPMMESSISSALSICQTPPSERSSHEPLRLPSTGTSSKINPRSSPWVPVWQSPGDPHESNYSEWHHPRTPAGSSKDNVEEVSRRSSGREEVSRRSSGRETVSASTRRSSGTDGVASAAASSASGTTSRSSRRPSMSTAWDACQPSHTRLHHHGHQGQSRSHDLRGSNMRAGAPSPVSPRLPSSAAMILGAGRQIPRSDDESCLQALAAIERSDRSRSAPQVPASQRTGTRTSR